MRIALRECCLPKDRGSMGARYVADVASAAGFEVAMQSDDLCDVELVSVHHCTDFPRLAALPRTGKIRLVGGHPMANNPRPCIPFADAVCIGEGETWIGNALRRLRDTMDVTALRGLGGTLVCRDYDGTVPPPNAEPSVPRNAPYLNRGNTPGHADTWYLELARGCPFACHYCELGHSVPYRWQDTEWLIGQLRGLDTSVSRRVNLFAPDAASHPGYGILLAECRALGLIQTNQSMRVDSALRHLDDFGSLPKSIMVRVGIDGLTEATRFRVGKRITDRQIVEYFRAMSDRGHANFKVFMVFGYPWETRADLDRWALVWNHIASIPRRTNAHVRIKFTPLIPQPCTPLRDTEAKYDEDMVDAIFRWTESAGKPRTRPGWYLESDGIMSRLSWRNQVQLTKGDETCLLA